MFTPLTDPQEFLSSLEGAVKLAQEASRAILQAESEKGRQGAFVRWAEATEAMLQLEKVADVLFRSAAMRWGETQNGKELRNASRAA